MREYTDRYLTPSVAGLIFWFAYMFESGKFNLSVVVVDINNDPNKTAIIAIIGIISGAIVLQGMGYIVNGVAFVVISIMRGRFSSFPRISWFGNEVKSKYNFDKNSPDEGIFHLLFYGFCDEKLEEWCHRRRNRLHIAITTILCIALSICIALIVSGKFAIISTIFATCSIGSLFLYGRHEMIVHDRFIESWMMAFLDSITAEKISNYVTRENPAKPDKVTLKTKK